MKLRTKLTLSMLLVGVTASMLVGGIAYWLLMRDFRQSVQDQAFGNFQVDVKAYLERYGSWQEGIAREPFPEFVQRTRALMVKDRLPDLMGARSMQLPSSPRDAMPPAEGIAEMGAVPFLFMLTDPSGRVVKPGGDYRPGERISDALLDDARPIVVDGQVRLLAIPLGDPNLTPQDQSYLAAMRHALGLGLAGAALIALLLGVLFSRRVCGRLYELTSAVHAMRADGELEQAVRYDQPLCVMIADLDHFKQINDSHSHAVGDQVLQRVARILRESIRKSDILARHGGEEFVVLFPQTSLQQAYERCDLLRRRIEAADWQSVHPGLRVTLSIGLNDSVALGSIEKMVSAADEALYAAKRAGRNCIEPAAA